MVLFSALFMALKALLTVIVGIALFSLLGFQPFVAMGVAVFLVDLGMVVLFSEEEEPTV